MFQDHCIYEFKVEFTQTVRHYDQCQEFSHKTQHPGTKATVRLIACRYSDEIAAAWLKTQFRDDSNLKVLSTAKHDIGGFLEDHLRS
jgi:hypothetical protein